MVKKIEDFYLKENPFRITPPLDPNQIIWAGMSNLKDSIENRIRLGIQMTNSKIVLNFGSYGSGKTHAANYYSKTKRIDEICTNLKSSKSKSIKVSFPRTSKDIVLLFLQSLLGQFSVEDIHTGLTDLKSKFKDDFNRIVESSSDDNIIKEFILNFSELDLSKVTDKKDFNLFKDYIYGDITKTTLKKLNLSVALTNDEQIVNLISSIFNCLSYEKSIFSSFFLWIDEFEDIDSISKSNSDRFTTFLRQLIDKTPNNLTVFLNFTPKKFLRIDDLSIYLGEALSSRSKIKIEFKSPSNEEVIQYIKELLEKFRTDNSISALHPFSEELILYILKNIGNLSIRKINEVLSIILEFAIILDKTIDKNFVDSIKDEIVSWEG